MDKELHRFIEHCTNEQLERELKDARRLKKETDAYITFLKRERNQRWRNSVWSQQESNNE